MRINERLIGPKLINQGEKSVSFTLTGAVDEALRNKDAMQSVDALFVSIANKGSIAAEFNRVLGSQHEGFRTNVTRSQQKVTPTESAVAKLVIDGNTYEVGNEVADILKEARSIAGNNSLVDTGHVISAMVESRRQEILGRLDTTKLSGRDPQIYLNEIVTGIRRIHQNLETSTIQQVMLSSENQFANILEVLQKNEGEKLRTPTEWLEGLVNGLRNDAVVRIESPYDLEAEILAYTLSGQLKAAAHKPLPIESVVFVSRESASTTDFNIPEEAFSNAKDGVIFLPYTEESKVDSMVMKRARQYNTKVAFYGTLPKNFDVSKAPVIYLDNVSGDDLRGLFESFQERFKENLGIENANGELVQPLEINPETIDRLIPLALRYAGAMDATPLQAMVAILEKAASTIHIAWSDMPLLRSKSEKIKKDYCIDTEDMYQAVYSLTGIEVKPDKPEKYLELESILSKSVIGQDEAIKSVSAAIRRAKSGLNDPNRPLGSYIFLGPSGVGKTELTKALAGFLFDDEDQLITLDMSQFMEKHTVSQLVGAPPGYVGYEEGGQLTEAVRKQPYSVVNFDEIEKAHPDVWNLLFQLMDEGRLTDGKGRKVDFKNSLIILTGNVGSDKYQNMGELMAYCQANKLQEDPRAYAEAEVKKLVVAEAKTVFPLAFLNRLDKLLVFRSLDIDNIGKIVGLQLNKTNKKLVNKNIRVELTPRATSLIAKMSYNPEFGAREVRRVLQDEIEEKLSDMLLSSEIISGDTVIFDEVGGMIKRVDKITG